MKNDDFHSPDECIKYVTHLPLKFSHKRYFLIRARQIIFFGRSNSPFLSSQSISKQTELKIFTLKRLNTWRINKAHSIYIKSDLLQDFFFLYGHLLAGKVIVSGGSDTNFDSIEYFPDDIKILWLQNSSIKNHDKIKTLPLGLEDLRLGRSGLRKYHSCSQNLKISDRIFVPPMSPSNQIRRKVIIECLRNPAMYDVQVELLDEEKYFSLVKKYQFVLCLEGNGHENHRIWETLYQGSFPVMQRTAWSSNLEYLKLPILFYSDIEDLNKEVLSDFAAENKGFNPKMHECLWTPFWKSIFAESSKGALS